MNLRRGAAFALLALGLAACGEGSDQRSAGQIRSERTDITLAQVYERMEQAITREGQVFHTRIQLVSVQQTFPTPPPGESISPSFVINDPSEIWYELWLDPNKGVGRVEQHYTGEDGPAVASRIVTTDEALRTENGNSSETSALLCRGSDSPLLAQLMTCGNYLEESNTRVMSATYDGRDAAALLTTGDLPSQDWTSPFEMRLYLDADTWLPIATEQETAISLGPGGTYKYEGSFTYTTEFVPRASLADNFFEPSAIGYVARDPEAALKNNDAGIPVYWLGLEFDGGGTLPTLQLDVSDVYEDPFPPGYRATLAYVDAGDEYGPPVIGMQEWATAEWEAFLAKSTGGNAWERPGVGSEEITLPNGRALLYRMAGRWGGDRYLAHVYLPGTVVMVMDFDSPSPYNNREGFLAVIHGLVERP